MTAGDADERIRDWERMCERNKRIALFATSRKKDHPELNEKLHAEKDMRYHFEDGYSKHDRLPAATSSGISLFFREGCSFRKSAAHHSLTSHAHQVVGCLKRISKEDEERRREKKRSK
jgi:hypothetical protein